MKPILFALSLAASLFADGDFKAQPGGGLPESAAALKGSLEATGTKIVDGSGKPYAEIWLRTTQPADAKSGEQNITLPELPHGALLGVISFPVAAADRRGQPIKAGVYTLRYSQFPITGDHQGVAPQRDFVVISPVADDKDPESMPKFDALMVMSRKASGTAHPLILSMWKSDVATPSLTKEGEHDWVLVRKIGSIPVAIIVSGRGEG